MIGPMVLVELRHKSGGTSLVLMQALDAAIFWDTEPLVGVVYVGIKIHWGELNARDWDMSM